MARRSVIRASDTERDAVAERLRRAAAEGRILASELEHRLTIALRARTLGELDALVADLPRGGDRRRLARPTPVRIVAYSAAVVAVLVVAAVAIAIIASLFAVWAVWMIVFWWAFGHRGPRRRGPRPYGRPPLRTARRGLL